MMRAGLHPNRVRGAKPLNMLFSLLLVLGLAITGIDSVSVVNNATVSSDILSDLFFNEIRNNNDLAELVFQKTKQYDSRKCILSLRAMITQFPSLKVIPFFDAWGKFPSGILHGSFYDVGNFDQCVGTSATLSTLTGVVSGQFCFASVPLRQQGALRNMPRRNQAPMMEARDDQTDFFKLSIGICVPNSCSAEVLTTIFQLSVGNAFNGALAGVSVSQCTDGTKPKYSALDIVGITIFCFFAALMVASTIYEFLMNVFEKKPVPLLLAFSVLANGKKLFAINTKMSPSRIDCLNGIRVFSMLWVMYGHTYGMNLAIPLINTIDILSWFRSAWSMHVISATVSVDSFFFISGVLVAWLGFKELERTNGKLNVVMMYVHRYIRLTPPVAAGLLFIFAVNKFIGSGPFRISTLALDTCNGYNWWPVLLYIQNYYIKDDGCYPQTWYLAIDFQLYILSPLLLLAMWKWGKKFVPVIVTLFVLTIGCVMATYITEGYTDLKGMSNEDEWRKVYVPTHTRYSPWLVGFCLGYYMFINRQKKIVVPKVIQLLGWIACFVTLVSIVFAPYFTISAHGYGTNFEATMYESLKRVSWAVALAWITFACQFGYGGVVNTFLSHPFWQPLGRLTYSMYLIHIAVLAINFGMMRTNQFFSDYNEILFFWSTFGISLTMAIGMALAFESPVLVLEKAIFGRSKPKQDIVDPTTSPAKILITE